MSPPNPMDWLAVGTWDQAKQGRAGRNSHTGSRAAGVLQQIKTEVVAVLLRDKMNVLLLLFPVAIISKAAGWAAAATFVLSLLPLCSLAERLGMITEQLAMYTNDTLGGLLNATFGNATEVIIAAFAIQKGILRVVKLTLLGSIISNLLLVMGSAFVAGGIVHSTQHFNQQGIIVNSGLLILAVVAIMLPTLLSSTAEVVKDFKAELALSRFESVLMLLCYGMFLVFQLVTHRHLYEDGGDLPKTASVTAGGPPAASGTSCVSGTDDPELPARAFGEMAPLPTGNGNSSSTLLPLRKQPVEVELVNGASSGQGTAAGPGGSRRSQSGGLRTSVSGRGSESGVSCRVGTPGAAGYAAVTVKDAAVLDEQPQSAGGAAHSEGEQVRLVCGQPSVEIIEEEAEEQVLSKTGCFVWLALVTVCISVLSDYIMDAITEASQQLKIPMPFLTTIVVPIVGNAAEHASALIFAVKNRMEISLGVAMGSSTQVGVLVVPFCVVLAWCMGQPLDLNFNEFEALVLFISVLLAALMVQDGTSNWLKGAMLIVTYLFVSAGFWVHKDSQLTIGPEGGMHH